MCRRTTHIKLDSYCFTKTDFSSYHVGARIWRQHFRALHRDTELPICGHYLNLVVRRIYCQGT